MAPNWIVVVADLEAETRELTVELLRTAGYAVSPTSDAATFQTLLRISPTPLVVAVRLDAPELARALLELFPTEPPATAGRMPWAQRHAYILQADTPRIHLVATALVRLGSVFVRSTPLLVTAHDATRLLTLVLEASEALGSSCP